MKYEDLLYVIDELGCKHKGNFGSNNIPITCPFAKFKDEDPNSINYGDYFHSGGVDNSPSVTIKVNPNGRSLFRCWSASCMHQGTLQDMIALLHHLEGYTYGDLLWFVHETEEELEAKKHSVVNHSKHQSRKQGYMVYSKEELGQFSSKYPRYLRERGITEETYQRWDLRWDRDEGRIILPIYSRKKELVGIRYRKIAKKLYRPLLRFDLQRWFFGEQFFSKTDEYVIVVEGEFDAMKLDQMGFSAVAIFGSTLKRRQLRKLRSFEGIIYLMWDDDLAGRRGASSAKEALPHARIVKLPHGMDPGNIDDPNIVEDLLDKADEESGDWMK